MLLLGLLCAHASVFSAADKPIVPVGILRSTEFGVQSESKNSVHFDLPSDYQDKETCQTGVRRVCRPVARSYSRWSSPIIAIDRQSSVPISIDALYMGIVRRRFSPVQLSPEQLRAVEDAALQGDSLAQTILKTIDSEHRK